MSLWWVPVLTAVMAVPWAVPRPVRGPGHQGAGLHGVRGMRRWRVWRRPEPDPEAHLDVAVLADMLGAAITAGASIPAAVGAVGRAMPGTAGDQFMRVAATLRLGGDWEAAWAHTAPRYRVLAGALQPAWEDGVAPGGLLTHAATRIRRRRAEASREAASRLGVQLVLPMGLCWLPAFVLLGLAPVVLSTGGTLWP